MAYLRTNQYGRNKGRRNLAPYGQVRANYPRHTGTVKWFNPLKGFGFIVPDDGSADVFVHRSAVLRSGMADLQPGQKIEYQLITGENGKAAAEKLKPWHEHPYED